jgi:isoquinoline 1-oxidoreductase alpha subunit
MMTAVALLEKNPSPAREEVAEAMSVAYCRCGTYMRIRQAVLRAAEIKAEGK